MSVRWVGVIAAEGAPSLDGRVITSDAVTWEIPLPLFMGAATGHPTPAGTVEAVWRHGGYLWARGVCLNGGTVAALLIDRGAHGVPVAMTLDRVVVGEDPDPDRLLITAGRLRSINVLADPAWAFARIYGHPFDVVGVEWGT